MANNIKEKTFKILEDTSGEDYRVPKIFMDINNPEGVSGPNR